MSRWLRRHREAVLLAVLFGLTAIYLQPSFAELHSPNPLVRIYLTRALVDDGTVAIDGPVRRYGDLSDKSRRQNHLYCDKAPGVSLAAVPIYAVMRLFAPAERISNPLLLAVARALLCVLPVALCLLLVDVWLLGLGVAVRRRSAVLAALGFGSLMLPYSLELFGHAPAGCLVLAAALCALGPGAGSSSSVPIPAWRGVLAGLCAGLAVLTEYPTLFVVAVVLGVGLFFQPRRLRYTALVAAGGALPALLFFGYNQLAFGGPLTTGYAFIDNAYFRNIHAQGFMGLDTPRFEALAASFVSPARGLFFAAPWTLAAPVGVYLLWRKDRASAIGLGAALLIYALFVSSFRYWIGGWALGQRHLTPVLPLAAVATGVALEACFAGCARWQRWLRPTLAAACAIAVLQVAAASLTMPTFAEEFENPFYELTLRIWRLGLFPHTLGSAAGLSSRIAMLLPITAAGVALLLCLRGAAANWHEPLVDGSRRALAALLVGVWLAVAPLILQGDARSQHRFEWIVDTVWEPRDALPAKLPDPVKTLPYIERRSPQSPAMLRHLARHLAASGEPQRALELVGQVLLREEKHRE